MSNCCNNSINAIVSEGFLFRGKDGISPTIEVEEDTESSYKLKITDVNGSFITPNLKGENGKECECEGGNGLDNEEIESLRNEVKQAKDTADSAFAKSESANSLAQKAYDLALNASNTGGQALIAGENIEIKENVISVLTTNSVDKDQTRPITAAGVNTIVGNIDVLLKLI